MNQAFPAIVYLLCLGASGLCALLLLRSYGRTRARLLLWSGICFTLLSANSLLVILDILIFPATDFRLWRDLLSLGAGLVLLFSFVWDLEQGE